MRLLWLRLSRPQAQADEEERLARDGMFTEGGKRRCMRPDRVTESSMKRPGGGAINREKRCGHVPGVAVSQRFYSRAELGCLGLHHPPIMGIEFVGEKDRAGPDVPLVRICPVFIRFFCSAAAALHGPDGASPAGQHSVCLHAPQGS